MGQQTTYESSLADDEIWSVEATVDQLFLCLAKVREQVANSKGVVVEVPIYYRQALERMHLIPVLQPTPIFIIQEKHLSPQIIQELERCKKKTQQYIVLMAVGRLFENLDSDYYHLSVARCLKVKFEK